MMKDPNKPRGRSSAYAFFVLSCRQELQNNGQRTPENLSTFFMRCSEQWKALGTPERNRFEDMEKADQARYEEEMKDYIPVERDGGPDQAASSNENAEFKDDEDEMDEEDYDYKDDYVMVKDPNKPKGRTTAYAYFILSCRDELQNKGQSIPENLSLFFLRCSEQWKTLNPSEKKLFEDMEKADQVRYDKEIKSYVPLKGSMKKRRKDSNKPRRPVSAFFVFCAEHRKTVKREYPNLSISEIARKLVEMWSKLSKKERSPFEQKAALLREKQEKDGGPGQAGGSTKVEVDDEDENEDDDDDEDEDDDDDDNDEDDE